MHTNITLHGIHVQLLADNTISITALLCHNTVCYFISFSCKDSASKTSPTAGVIRAFITDVHVNGLYVVVVVCFFHSLNTSSNELWHACGLPAWLLWIPSREPLDRPSCMPTALHLEGMTVTTSFMKSIKVGGSCRPIGVYIQVLGIGLHSTQDHSDCMHSI